MPDVRQFILDYIQSEYTIPTDADIDSVNYVQAGYVDSVGIIHFVVLLEDAFGIEFAEEELTGLEFQTVGTLVDLIERKMG